VPVYSYKAKDRYGVELQGNMEAASSTAVASRLAGMGYIPVFIVEQSGSVENSLEDWMAQFQGVKMEEMIVFIRQLSSILGAGVPLLESLEALYEQMSSRKLRNIILRVRKDIEGGSSFSDALERDKKVFTPVFIAMVRAGERAGILGEVLERLAALLERDYENSQKIKSALRYPMMVVIALGIAFLIVVTFVIPQFTSMYNAFRSELPLPTRVLMGINYGIRHYFVYIFIIAGLLGYTAKKLLDTERGKVWWDRFTLSVPVFGTLINKLILARFCRMLSSMLKSGIPILDALSITRDTVGNKILSKAVDNMKEDVTRGTMLSEPMRGAKIFPPLAVQMVAIGEKSGSLEAMLSKVADYFDRDANYMITNLMPLIEPLLLLGLAFVVVLLALGVYLPMWDMVKLIK
jgi:type II secretory pathway component PulF